MAMNFRDMEYALEAARYLSFSKAAAVCGVSQPTLSTQVKKIEGELGTPIFVRTSRGISLSPFGEVFVRKANLILELREDLRRDAFEHGDLESGQLRLGGIMTVAPYLFPELVQRARTDLPGIDLILEEAKTSDLVAGLLNGRIDAAIISLPTDEYILEVHELFREPFYCAVPAGHALGAHRNLTLEDLAGRELILLEEGHCFRTQTMDLCLVSAAKENRMLRATSLETVRQFVTQGAGLTLMPQIARRDDDGLAYLALEDGRFYREIAMVWRKGHSRAPLLLKIAALIEAMRNK